MIIIKGHLRFCILKYSLSCWRHTLIEYHFVTHAFQLVSEKRTVSIQFDDNIVHCCLGTIQISNNIPLR